MSRLNIILAWVFSTQNIYAVIHGSRVINESDALNIQNIIPLSNHESEEFIIFNEFIKDVIKESNFTYLVFILSSSIELDSSGLLVGASTYDINSLKTADIPKLKNAQVESSSQYLYLVLSHNSSTVSVAIDLIRQVDVTKCIMAFTGEPKLAYNTYYLKRVLSQEFTMSEVCMFCDTGRDVIKEVNKWSLDHGFHSQSLLLEVSKVSFGENS